jgi:hypothetical protein
MSRPRHRRRWGVLARVLRRNQGVTVPAPRFAGIAVTDGLTRVTHRVSSEAMSDGRRTGGRYRAFCGVQLWPASLIDPGQGRCPACEQ